MNDQSSDNLPVAVITGSSSGIGASAAKRFANEGYRVVVHCGSNKAAGEKVVQEIVQKGGQGKTILSDFSIREPKFENFFNSALSCYKKVDIWVNCAGGDVLTTEKKEWSFQEKLDFLWRVDVRATLVLSNLAANWMVENGISGSVVNIGWDGADAGLPGHSGQLFAATKGAIHGLTRSLAQTFAPNIRFNCVAPGWIQTKWGQQTDPTWNQWVGEHNLLNRWGQPEEIAKLIYSVATNSFLNGQVIHCNGGIPSAFGPMKDHLKT